MEITTAEGYILYELFKAQERVEKLEAELEAQKGMVEGTMAGLQRYAKAIERHREVTGTVGGGERAADFELWRHLLPDYEGVPGVTQEMEAVKD